MSRRAHAAFSKKPRPIFTHLQITTPEYGINVISLGLCARSIWCEPSVRRGCDEIADFGGAGSGAPDHDTGGTSRAGYTGHRNLHGREGDGPPDLLPAEQYRLPAEDDQQADGGSSAQARRRESADRGVEGERGGFTEGACGLAGRAKANGGRSEESRARQRRDRAGEGRGEVVVVFTRRANGTRERAPDDRLSEAIHSVARTDGLLRRSRSSRRWRKPASSRYPILLHHLEVRIVAEAGALRHRDIAIGIGIDAAAPQAGGAFHVEDLDQTFAADRHQVQRGEEAGPEIRRVRNDLDPEFVAG